MHVEENRLPYFKKLISSLQVLRKQSAIFVVLDEILNCKHVNYRVKIAIKSFLYFQLEPVRSDGKYGGKAEEFGWLC